MSFKKDFTYVVKSGKGHWYIVKQTGMKSWVAMNFANARLPEYDLEVMTGNGKSLYAKLNPTVEESFLSNEPFRRTVFNVCKYGHIHET